METTLVLEIPMAGMKRAQEKTEEKAANAVERSRVAADANLIGTSAVAPVVQGKISPRATMAFGVLDVVEAVRGAVRKFFSWHAR